MARSLTVTQEETPRPSMLFMVFVALCCGLLALTWASVGAEADEPITIEAPPAD
ncbi:MAG: hypothetical protein AAF602_11490 [Myxococcota bacterium]